METQLNSSLVREEQTSFRLNFPGSVLSSPWPCAVEASRRAPDRGFLSNAREDLGRGSAGAVTRTTAEDLRLEEEEEEEEGVSTDLVRFGERDRPERRRRRRKIDG